MDGIAKAKAIGTKFGRKVKATPERIFTMRADGETGPEAMRDQRSPKVMMPKQFLQTDQPLDIDSTKDTYAYQTSFE
ncbi:hypothetical protein NKH57_17820 [Mesorhizobium sp. M1050]|uniref:hypothetical protein n=1 Tax=Mesorhizobium sp. M1050 TaxID=2957051 RepID=UPI003336C6EF